MSHSPATPGQEQLGPWIESFDDRADALLEQLRGNPIADRLFATASHVGDFSLVWHAINIVRGLVRGRPDQMLALAVSLGVESLVVNQGVKRLFRRQRPTTGGDERLPVRTPSTSSFPSGHASSAVYAATLLTAWERSRRSGAARGSSAGTSAWIMLWWSVAAVVGVSRAYVRIHHASDVVGGAVVGRVLGLAAVRAIRRAGIS